MGQGEPYWLVCRAGREPLFPPNFQHSTVEAARAEAVRLARANPGVQFVVLESVSAHRAVDMEAVDLRPDRGLPL